MGTLLFFVGTRPELVKIWPIFRCANMGGFPAEIVWTGQQRLLGPNVAEDLELDLKLSLKLEPENRTVVSTLATILTSGEDLLNNQRTSGIVVQGDTTTAMAGCLLGFLLKVPIFHVEAGLRTWNLRSPFPEEGFRCCISQLASFHFAPTQIAKKALISSGVSADSIEVVGNTAIDAIRMMREKLDRDDQLRDALVNEFRKLIGIDICNEKYVLITGHRRENHGASLDAIWDAISQLARRFTDFFFIVLSHSHPNVQIPLRSKFNDERNVRVIEPLAYSKFCLLMKHCSFIISDSGGIQEEAPEFSKPVLITRDVTERTELIEAGGGILVGDNTSMIFDVGSQMLSAPGYLSSYSINTNPFGDGTSSEKIIEKITEFR